MIAITIRFDKNDNNVSTATFTTTVTTATMMITMMITTMIMGKMIIKIPQRLI